MRDQERVPRPTAETPAPPTVLIVEDEVLLRLLVADELRLQNYTVIEAANADDALGILRSGVRVNLIISDIRMPGRIDGCGLVSAVKSLWPEVKLVIASAHADRVQQGTADAVFPKPYEIEDLLLTVNELAPASPSEETRHEGL